MVLTLATNYFQQNWNKFYKSSQKIAKNYKTRFSILNIKIKVKMGNIMCFHITQSLENILMTLNKNI